MAGLRPDQIVSQKIWAPGIFDGKVVFCTGGAGTICSAQVGALVLLGANAVILGRRLPTTQKAAAQLQSLRAGSTVLGLSCDVRSPASLAAAVDETLAKLGRIDYVIAGAAGNFLAPVSSLSENAFKTVVEIDLLGSYNTVKAVLPYFKSVGGKGKKVLFVSATMHYTGTPFQAHAAAAKAAVDALSATLAVELGPMGVTSNVIAPGPIVGTEGMARLKPPGVGDAEIDEKVPMQRQGTVRDIADATVWLLSAAGDWVTGSVVVVDGGAWRTQGGSIPGYPAVMGMDWDELTGRKKNGGEKAKL